MSLWTWSEMAFRPPGFFWRGTERVYLGWGKAYSCCPCYLGAARAPPRVTAAGPALLHLLLGGCRGAAASRLPPHPASRAGAPEARKSLCSEKQGRQQHRHSRSLLCTDWGLSEASWVLLTHLLWVQTRMWGLKEPGKPHLLRLRRAPAVLPGKTGS